MKIWPDEKPKEEKYFRLVREDKALMLVETNDKGERLSTGAILAITKDGIELCSGYRGSLPADEAGIVKIIT